MRLLPLFARPLLVAQWQRHPGRTWVGILSIAIGVAMGYAIYLINHTALDEFARGARLLAGQADLQVRGPRSGFDESLYPRLAALPGVAAASPVVEIRVAAGAHDLPLTLVGIDVFRALDVTPGLVGRTRTQGDAGRLAHLDPAQVFLSPAALAALDAAPGGRVALQGSRGPVDLEVAGTLPAAQDTMLLGVMDIGAAQWRFGESGRLQRIDLRLQAGANAADLQAAIDRLLPAGVHATVPADQRSVTADLSRAYRVNLNVLALMALFTGAFLIYSGQVLSTTARRSQLGLLRALGATRRDLMRLLLAESLTLGLAGAVLGVGFGYGIAAVALQHLGTDLGGGYFSTTPARVQAAPLAAADFICLGMLAAALGGYFPARQAAQTSPAAALRAGSGPTEGHARAPWAGLAWIAAGAALLPAGPIAGLPIPAYLATAGFLVGAILCMPWIAQRCLTLLPHWRRAAWFLAVGQLAASPARAAVAVSGILASFGLMTSMVIMVNSFRVSFDDWLNVVLPAQLYVRAAAEGTTGHFSAREQALVAATPGVRQAEFMQTDWLTLSPRLPQVALIIRPIPAADPGARLSLVHLAPPDETRLPAVWVSEAMTQLYGLKAGQTWRLPLAGRWQTVRIAGVWRDYARQFGAIALDTTEARHLGLTVQPTEAALWLAPHATLPAVSAALQAALARPGIEFHSTGEIRERSLRIFDRSFAVTWLLEAVAIAVGLSGIGVYFGAQALARASEFGMLRHLGVTRRQIAAMLALEGCLLGTLGVIVGLLLGGSIAGVLVYLINPQSFHWTMTLVIPWDSLAAAALALIAAAALAAWLSGWRATSITAVRAVREDW